MWTPQGSVVIDDATDIEDAKSSIRSHIREHRQDRSPRATAEAGAAIAAQIPELLTPEIRVVAAFASRPSEPDMTPVLAALHAGGVRVLLPQLGPGLSRNWADYAPGQELTQQAPGRPPAPVGPSLGEDALAGVDLVLAPALAIDSRGYRLGQGGGWYDRALAYRRPGVPVYAVIFADEFTEIALPIAPHDLPVDGVITPDGIIRGL